MRRFFLLSAAALLLAAAMTANAQAESIKGRLGVTARIGIINPADSELDSQYGKMVVSTNAGFIGGGGFLFGVDDSVAVEMDVTKSSFHTSDFGTANITDVAVGAQYRFPERQRVVPYVGGGLDVLINDLHNKYTNTTIGGHLSAGADLIVSREAALTAEIKAVESFHADTDSNGYHGEFDPSNVSVTFGARFFFN